MAINKYFKSIEEARDYIRHVAKYINPSNTKLKKNNGLNGLTLVVGNKHDYVILNNALVGMHPQFRQTPPSFSLSMIQTFRPS